MEQQTYQQILERMEAAFAAQAGFVPDDASDIGIRFKVLAGEIFNLYSGMQWLGRQVFPQTAFGEYLEMHAAQKGLTRREETVASGTLTFRREKALTYPLAIPKGTICALASDPAIRFVTTEAAELEAFSFSVAVPAVSEHGGAQYNVAAGTITQMVTPPVGLETVTNESAFSGGADDETDEQLRKRLLLLFQNQSNGTNKAFYTDFAMRYDGVYSANTVARTDQTDGVTVYICGKDGSVPSELRTKIQTDLNAAKEVNVSVTVLDAEEKAVNFACYIQPAAPYRLADVIDQCEAIVKSYIGELHIGESFVVAQVLQRMMSAGLVANYKLYSYTTDVAMEPNQRAKYNSVLLTQMT